MKQIRVVGPAPRVPVSPTRTRRKVALVGGAPTLVYAPWDDFGWEIWAHASCAQRCKRVDRYFDPHPRHCFEEKAKNGFFNYYEWLQTLTIPIYMQDKFRDIPASVKIPKDRILTEHRRFLHSTGAWMVALAMLEGVETIGCFGMHFDGAGERQAQRENFLYWLGLFEGNGGRVVTPPSCTLFAVDTLYGYESHTAEQYEARKKMHANDKADPTFNPKALVDAGPVAPLTEEYRSGNDLIQAVLERQQQNKREFAHA